MLPLYSIVTMKKTTLFIAVFSLLFSAILLAVLFWYGYFSTVQVQEKPVGPYTMVYRVHTGSPAGVAKVMEEVCSRLQDEFQVADAIGFGLYYDDPQTVAPENCRAVVGCIIEDDQQGDLHAIADSFTVARFPRGMAVVVDFPYKNKLSVLFGMLKGYPVLSTYVEGKGLAKKPVLEMYDVKRGRIRYVHSTGLADSFFETYLILK